MTSALLLGSALATAPILAGAAGAANTSATLTATPANVCAGVPTLVTLTVTFPGPDQAIGVIPSGATILADSASTPITSSVGTATLQGNGDLAVGGFGTLVAGTAATVSFYAIETAATGWQVQGDAASGEGVPDPDNAGDSGDDYLATATTTIDTGCHLAITAQPASTALSGGSAPISNLLGGSYGSPVAVQVEDGGGNPEPVSTSVTLALSADAALTGNVAQTSATGLAVFGSLANGMAGQNLTLAASATGIAASAPSTPFDIYDSGTVCTGSCNTSPAPGFSLSATGGTGGFLAAFLPSYTLSCSALRFGLYPGIPGTTTVGFTYINGATTKTVTLFVARSLLTTLRAKLLALHYMVCFSSPTAFRTVFGTMAQYDATTTAFVNDGQNWYTGLLPDCEDTGHVAPCVQARTWSSSPVAGLHVTVLAPAGDPFGR